MSIGDGIVLSTIIIIVFIGIIFITKKHKWGTFFKVLIGLIILGMLIAAGFWLYDKYENRPQVVTSLNGISLGMSEVEVTLAKGKPDESHEVNESKQFGKIFIYKDYDDTETVLTLYGSTKDSLEVDLICALQGYKKIFGLGSGSFEKDIYAKLGKPSHISIDIEGTSKRISYPEWNIGFDISKGRVDVVCVTSRPMFSYRNEYGNDGNSTVKHPTQ